MSDAGSVLARGAPPEHLVRIAGGWSVWRWVRLRGSGFPATMVLDLATSDLARRVDAVRSHEVEAAARRREAIALCEAALDAAEGDARKALVRSIRRLRAGQSLETLPFGAEQTPFGEAVTRLSAAESALARARADAELASTAEATRTGHALRAMVGARAFREALTWQNRGALQRGIASLERTPAGATDKETRKRELLVARYAQRYCVKNDTIGFFGPVGWGTFAPDGDAITLRPGPGLVSAREVYFEHWCIDALASKLAEDPELKPFMHPRRMPTVRVEGSRVHVPIERSIEVPADVARLLAACDGEHTAQRIAEDRLAEEGHDFSGVDEVFYRLDELVEQGLLTWTLEVPTGIERPEARLRELLEGVPDGPARARALGALDAMEARRSAVLRAAGDPEALAAALDELDRTFAEITGRAGTRRGGETYAGRTLVYEDCRRDVELRIGPELLDKLAGPVSLLLQSARWYTWVIAERYRVVFAKIYEGLRNKSGASAVDYLRYRDQVDRYFTEHQAEASTIVDETVASLKRHWSEILRLDAAAHREERRVADLHEQVVARFAAPRPGWPQARYHSPDVLVVARDAEAIRRGEYELVLGELHVSANTLLTNMALVQHDDPEALLRARSVDLPGPGIAPIESRQHAMRADHFSVSREDLHVELGATRSWRPRSQVIAVSELVVEDVEGSLVVRTRDHRRSFDIVEFFEQYLMFASLGHFSIAPPGPHIPRVTVDGVVYLRETWRFEAAALPFLAGESVLARFDGARRWAAEHGLPRFVFFKVPEEPKPCYLDFESSIYVEMFVRMVAQASSVTISEMLPGVADSWLEDAAGRRYTSELRIAAVDDEPWRAPAARAAATDRGIAKEAEACG